MKYCSCCNKSKSKDDFYKDGTRKDGHANKCKVCARMYDKRRSRTWDPSERSKAVKKHNTLHPDRQRARK